MALLLLNDSPEEVKGRATPDLFHPLPFYCVPEPSFLSIHNQLAELSFFHT
jgi:hypothetical protein